LQGNLFFIVGAPDVELSQLIPLQLNPPCIPMPFDESGNEGRKYDRAKSVGTMGRRHNTLGRHGIHTNTCCLCLCLMINGMILMVMMLRYRRIQGCA
jgi:hypothetical protein